MKFIEAARQFVSKRWKQGYWLALTGALTLYVWPQATAIAAGTMTPLAAFAFVVWALLVLGPLYSEVELFGFKVKREIEKAKEEVRGEISSLRTEIATAINIQSSFRQTFHFAGAVAQSIPIQEVRRLLAEAGAGPRHLMEYKILNTLWTKQVNKHPDFAAAFGFMDTTALGIEREKYKEAAAKLIGEGLVVERSEFLYLTALGFDYCKQHHREFPEGIQYWPEETIIPENLSRVLGKGSMPLSPPQLSGEGSVS